MLFTLTRIYSRLFIGTPNIYGSDGVLTSQTVCQSFERLMSLFLQFNTTERYTTTVPSTQTPPPPTNVSKPKGFRSCSHISHLDRCVIKQTQAVNRMVCEAMPLFAGVCMCFGGALMLLLLWLLARRTMLALRSDARAHQTQCVRVHNTIICLFIFPKCRFAYLPEVCRAWILNLCTCVYDVISKASHVADVTVMSARCVAWRTAESEWTAPTTDKLTDIRKSVSVQLV